ncbi:MAG: VWA domain-containing protein [bacterium]|nr:VWA domain-containing protein [bacterium]
MKKALLSLSALALAVASVPMFAAFEAHVINVTARIENALSVNTKPIEFGTVFPQEKLDKFIDISLSQSFVDEDRVDDIDYMIRQKPKCGHPVPSTNPNEPVAYDDYKPVVGHNKDTGEFICPVGYVPLPLLCPYLSKHEISPDGIVSENDSRGIPAFHGVIDGWTLQTTLDTQVTGHLAKSQQDNDDQWLIDLKTPCFEGQCAQDWDDFVHAANPTATPSAFIQPTANEHQIFGCDLWIEVFGISLPGLGCKTLDMMLVIDRSGSIDSTTELPLLKTAAKAFVDAVNPSTAGTHVGQSSFSDTGTLDLHLSDSEATIDAAIDALVNGGFTNLKEGIELATGELDSADPHERPVVPDVMVIMTDGNPNRPNGNVTLDKAAAKTAADAAKAAGVEIYVVGIGGDVDATFLKTIASGDDHYFSAADFATLQAELEKLASCPENGT